MKERLKERGMMSQQSRLIQLPIIGMFLLGLLAIAFWVGRKRSSHQEPASAVRKHTVETSSEDALKYWTADKMRKAKPAKMPNVKGIDREKPQPRHTPHTPDSHNA
jgi:flagellar basal body-associated protein FliL